MSGHSNIWRYRSVFLIIVIFSSTVHSGVTILYLREETHIGASGAASDVGNIDDAHVLGIGYLDRNMNNISDRLENRSYEGFNQGQVRIFIFPKKSAIGDIETIIQEDPFASIVRYYDFIDAFLVSVDGHHIPDLLKKLRGKFLWVEEDLQGTLCGTLYNSSELLAKNYWRTNYGGVDDVAVAIIDSGVDCSHPELREKVIYYHDVTGESPEPIDKIGHGTMIASIIAGRGLVGEGDVVEIVHYGRVVQEETVLALEFKSKKRVNITLKWSSPSDGEVLLDVVNESGYTRRVAETSEEYVVTSMIMDGGVNRLVLTGVDGEVDYVVSVRYKVEKSEVDVRGIAPNIKLAVWKITKGLSITINSSTVIEALREVLLKSRELNIVVVNLSISFSKQILALDEAVNKLVMSGITVVTSAGNDFVEKYPKLRTNHIGSPGTAYLVTTVAATNEFRGITIYSSRGGEYEEDGIKYVKPDVSMFGGGLLYGGWVIAADSNFNDFIFEDITTDDYTANYGTSFATAIISGYYALMASYLWSCGKWMWNLDQALRLKSTLLACTYETAYIGKHEECSLDGTVSREPPEFSHGDKDFDEGYGIAWVDACIDGMREYDLEEYRDIKIEEPLDLENPVIFLAIDSNDLVRITFETDTMGGAVLCLYDRIDYDGSPKCSWYTLENDSKIFLAGGRFYIAAKLVRDKRVSIKIHVEMLAKREVVYIVVALIAVLVVVIIAYVINRIIKWKTGRRKESG